MLTEMARIDLERIREHGFSPTDDQIIRLNDLAVRIQRGKDTTAANMPRFAVAGNVVLHEPTIGALEWWHNFGRDAFWLNAGKFDCYFFMLVKCRDPEAFKGLESAADIRKAVKRWRRGVFATRDELWRALMWVKTGGEDYDAMSAKVLNSLDDEAVMDRLFTAVIAASGAYHLRPDDLKCVTRDTLTAMMISANLHAKVPVKPSIARDYIAYRQLIREIESPERLDDGASSAPDGANCGRDAVHDDPESREGTHKVVDEEA